MKFKGGLIVFLTGGPASGKDTQAALLAKKLKAKKLNVSEILDNFFQKTKKRYLRLGRKLINIQQEREKRFSGNLVSFDLVAYLMTQEILKNFSFSRPLIVLGGPRSLKEAKAYINLVKKLKTPFFFIYLEISEEEMIKRSLKRQRGDTLDEPEKIKKRIELFKKYTLPAINYLKKRRFLIQVNGEGEIKKIHQEIWQKIKAGLNF